MEINEEDKELRVFLINILTDLESLKSSIYSGSDVAAYRATQKIMDKIKTRIRENMVEGKENAE